MITADFEAYLTDDWYGQQITVDALLECEAEAGFEMAVVMPQTKPFPDNDGLLDKTAEHPQLLPCPLVDPHWGEEGISALKTYVDRGAQGVKLMGAIHKYNVDDPMVIPFVETARDLGIVVSIHSGAITAVPSALAMWRDKYPVCRLLWITWAFPTGLTPRLKCAENAPMCIWAQRFCDFTNCGLLIPKKLCRMRSNRLLMNWDPNGLFLGPICRNIARFRSSGQFKGWNWVTKRKH